MNSKECLERLLKYVNINEADLITKYGYSALNDIKTIKKKLDKLEKLEEENLVLLVNKNAAQCIAKKFKEENDKLKKALEILKSKFKFELGVSVVKEKYCYSLEFLYNNQYFTITQEQYELLKEVLRNDWN